MITHQSIGAFSLHFWYPDVDNRKNLHFLVWCCFQKSRQSFSIVPKHVRYMLFYFFLTFRKLMCCLAESKIPYNWPKPPSPLFIITCFINSVYFRLYFRLILHFIHSDSEFNLNFLANFSHTLLINKHVEYIGTKSNWMKIFLSGHYFLLGCISIR